MATEQLLISATITTLLSTELNSLANNALAVPASSGYYDNTIGQTGNGYTIAELELVVTFGTAPTVNTGVSLWFCLSQDGTNYETGYNASVTPARLPDCVFPLLAVTTLQRIIRRVALPEGKLIALLKNDGTAQAFPATGSTVKIRPVTRQIV